LERVLTRYIAKISPVESFTIVLGPGMVFQAGRVQAYLLNW
jgi:hypothetical protein